jgi:hypothetical protein
MREDVAQHPERPPSVGEATFAGTHGNG